MFTLVNDYGQVMALLKRGVPVLCNILEEGANPPFYYYWKNGKLWSTYFDGSENELLPDQTELENPIARQDLWVETTHLTALWETNPELFI